MKHEIKCVALDIDGTLLNEHHELTECTRKTLIEYHQAGVYIVLCTGRPLSRILPLVNSLELYEASDYSITFNGGLIQRNYDQHTVYQCLLSSTDLKRIQTVVMSLGASLDMIYEDHVYQIPGEDPKLLSIYKRINPTMHFHQGIVELDHAYKCVISSDNLEALDALLPKLRHYLADHYQVKKSRACFIEIFPKASGKDHALQQLQQLLNIKQAEIMAIGDQENDLDMIRHAGVGIAMGNAVASVKAAADYITRSNAEEGVVYALKQWGPCI